MMNWNDFFDMGGYAFHVWTSWSLTLVALIVIVLFHKYKNAKIKADLLRQIKREQRLQAER